MPTAELTSEPNAPELPMGAAGQADQTAVQRATPSVGRGGSGASGSAAPRAATQVHERWLAPPNMDRRA
jgi:hypothetical protein